MTAQDRPRFLSALHRTALHRTGPIGSGRTGVRFRALAATSLSTAFFAAAPGLFLAAPAWAASPDGLGPQILSLLPSVVPFVGAFAAAGAALLHARRETAFARRRADRAEAQAARLAARLGQAEAVLATEPGAIMLWPAAAPAEAEPWLFGRLAGYDTSGDTGGYRALCESLTPADAERFSTAVTGLREDGLAFSLALKAKDGRGLETEGRPTAGVAAVWIRDGAAERHEIDRLSGLLASNEAERASETALLDALPVPVWRRNEALELIWVNGGYAQAVDLESPEAAITLQAELDAMGRQLAQRARREGAPITEPRALVISGERRVMETTEIPTAEGSLGFALDVTALDETRQELERHIAANRDTLDHLGTAVAIFGPDRALRFCNKAYVALWRLDEAWLATSPKDGEILEALREARRLPEQANFPQWKRRRMALYTKVVSEPEELWHLPDGRTLRVVVRPHPHGGLLYLYEDVSDQLALESSHRLLIGVQRATIDKLFEGVALFGSDGALKLFNPAFCRIWSLEPEKLAEGPHFAAVAEWCMGQLDDAREWEILAGRVTSLDPERRAHKSRFERRDGTIIDANAMPLPDGATLLTMIDVTDTEQKARALAERNSALEEADRTKSAFVGHVSYQLRTPLNAIIGFTTMLDQAMLSEPLQEKQKEYVGNVLTASNQLLRLIDDILDLATIEAGRMTLDLAETDVAGAIKAAAGLSTKRAQEGKLQLELKLDEGLGRIIADERRIKQVVFNLLQNAIAFTPPGGRITVSASRSGGEVRIAVVDTGQGIAPRAQATVFDRFEARGSDGRRGAGLGLSLVKSFVQLHGGWVALQSEPGKGTTVTCHLPEVARVAGAIPERHAAE